MQVHSTLILLLFYYKTQKLGNNLLIKPKGAML